MIHGVPNKGYDKIIIIQKMTGLRLHSYIQSTNGKIMKKISVGTPVLIKK